MGLAAGEWGSTKKVNTTSVSKKMRIVEKRN